MRTLLIFGSEDFELDNGAVKLMMFLKIKLHKKWELLKAERPEQVMGFIGKEFAILDVAKGIEKPMLITNLDDLTYRKHKVTAHDLDLASFLKILRETGQIDKVNIVAIPSDKNPDEFKDEVVRLIKGLETEE